jgi:hypothetical protein
MRPIPSLRSSLVTGLLRVAAAAVIGLLISVGSAIESFHQRNRLDLSNYKMTFDESFARSMYLAGAPERAGLPIHPGTVISAMRNL